MSAESSTNVVTPGPAPGTETGPEAAQGISATTGTARHVGRWTIRRTEGGPDDAVVFIHSATAAAPEPADWAERLVEFFRLSPDIVCVGAKRLEPDGHIFSLGEFVIHSKGFHHHGKGVDGRCYRFAEEVDLIAGGVFAVRADAFDEAGGTDLLEHELGVLDLGLTLRRNGGRCVAVPQVVVVDTWTPAPLPADAAAFHARWGFDWNVADLDAVRATHQDTGLLWNVRYHAPGMPFEKYDERGALVWESYDKADFFRQRAHHLADLARKICPTGRLLDLGSGDGFFSHLIAMNGVEVIGIDPEHEGVEQARTMTSPKTYPGSRPTFQVGDGTALPFEDGAFQAVTNFDVIEHLPNPVAVLKEAARVLTPGGQLMVVTPAYQFGGSSDAIYHLTEYTMEELVRQVGAIEGLTVGDTGMIQGIYRDLIVFARKG